MSMPTLSATSTPSTSSTSTSTTTITAARDRHEAAIVAAAKALDALIDARVALNNLNTRFHHQRNGAPRSAAELFNDIALEDDARSAGYGSPIEHAEARVTKAIEAYKAAFEERSLSLDKYLAAIDRKPAPAPKPVPPPSPTITACRITECRGYGHDHDIMVTLDGKEESLYSFFCDEKSYRAADFVGMTRDTAIAKLLGDDQRYLRG